ncbi:MAG: type II secretion system protein GspM [Candidatus Woesearchaeota archaeon]
MIENMSLREKIIVFLGIIILIAALYYFYIYLPLSQKAETLESSLNQKEKRINILENNTKNIKELKDKHKSLEEELASKEKTEDIEKKYDTTTSDLLKYFNKKSEETDILMKSFNPKEDEEKVEISYSYTGDFYEILDFFSKVDQFQENIGYETFSANLQGEELSSTVKLIFPKDETETGDEND